MSRKSRPTKSVQQIMDKRIDLLFEDIEEIIEEYKKLIKTKNKKNRHKKDIARSKSEKKTIKTIHSKYKISTKTAATIF